MFVSACLFASLFEYLCVLEFMCLFIVVLCPSVDEGSKERVVVTLVCIVTCDLRFKVVSVRPVVFKTNKCRRLMLELDQKMCCWKCY